MPIREDVSKKPRPDSGGLPRILRSGRTWDPWKQTPGGAHVLQGEGTGGAGSLTPGGQLHGDSCVREAGGQTLQTHSSPTCKVPSKSSGFTPHGEPATAVPRRQASGQGWVRECREGTMGARGPLTSTPFPSSLLYQQITSTLKAAFSETAHSDWATMSKWPSPSHNPHERASPNPAEAYVGMWQSQQCLKSPPSTEIAPSHVRRLVSYTAFLWSADENPLPAVWFCETGYTSDNFQFKFHRGLRETKTVESHYVAPCFSPIS